MQTAQSGTSEIAISGRVLERDQALLSEAAARTVLDLELTRVDRDRMAELSARASEGLLSSAEQVEINNL